MSFNYNSSQDHLQDSNASEIIRELNRMSLSDRPSVVTYESRRVLPDNSELLTRTHVLSHPQRVPLSEITNFLASRSVASGAEQREIRSSERRGVGIENINIGLLGRETNPVGLERYNRELLRDDVRILEEVEMQRRRRLESERRQRERDEREIQSRIRDVRRTR